MSSFAPRLGWIVIACCLSVRGLAQDVPVIQVETHLVNIALSVHDADGKLVTGLGKDDFVVDEDGVRQSVRFFVPSAQLPLSVGLLIDVSGSQEKFIKEHEAAIEGFLSRILTPDGRAYAVCFGNHLRLVSDMGASAAETMAGIRAFDKGVHKFPEIGPKEDRDLGTALYDAVYYAVAEKLAGERQRRKVLVVLSDGEENSSEHDLLDAISSAQNADTVIYSVRYTETRHGEMNARDRYGARVLDHLSSLTGGRSFNARTTDLHEAFGQIADDLGAMYEVAYQSTNRVRDGGYRKIAVQSTRAGVSIRCRAGYYAR